MPSSLEEGFFYPRVSHPPCTQVEKPYFVFFYISNTTLMSQEFNASDMGRMDAGLYSKQFVHSE